MSFAEYRSPAVSQMIAALPAKGTNWKGLLADLVALYNSAGKGEFEKAYCHAIGNDIPVSDVKHVRDFRFNCMSAANWYPELAARRTTFIPPSPETLAWGGFLGGEHVTTIDRDIEEAAENEVHALINKYMRKES